MTVQADEQLAAQAIAAGAYEEAVRLLRPLVERNSEYALLTLGWIYETGAVGAPDKDAARLYYGRAAAAGSASAYHDLGRLLSGQGEESQARAAFEAGAERGNILCMARLGRMMVEGRGGLVDIGVGSAWLENAAAQGHIFARRHLLGIEARNARSIFGKLFVGIKVVLLAMKGAREMLKEPRSDKVR
jgi:TPR repeat protein